MKLGCNTQVHRSNARKLSVQLSSAQASKNLMSFLLTIMFSLQQNGTSRGRNKFCSEVGGEVKVAQTMYTHENKCKNHKIKKRKE
jgi:hypothetical protein